MSYRDACELVNYVRVMQNARLSNARNFAMKTFETFGKFNVFRGISKEECFLNSEKIITVAVSRARLFSNRNQLVPPIANINLLYN